ncbi:MAG: ROK family protein [Erysipelotrichaceae bacterium]|nr:ROK family protein [Erysipelotrichaceae bacterium]MDP3305867.1 ROK family protein [Erysipelotrichaceae bacterium]
MIFSINQRKLMGLLLTEGPLSRKVLAAKMKLTNAAITVMTQSLIEEGLIVELGEVESGKVGRKETLIDLSSSKYVSIGLDIRINHTNISITDIKGKQLNYKKVLSIENAIEYLKRNVSKEVYFHEIAVLCRGYRGLEIFDQTVEKVEKLMGEAQLPYKIVHNVSALAILHKFYHPNDSNFLLVKYGPGVGSAIVTNGVLLSNDRNRSSEFGHMVVDPLETQTLEELISYATVAEDIEESEVVEYLVNSRATLDYIMAKIAFCIVNSHVLLGLDKIIVAGNVFVYDEVFQVLKDKIHKYNRFINEDDLVRIDDYDEKERKIGSIVALFLHFLDL